MPSKIRVPAFKSRCVPFTMEESKFRKIPVHPASWQSASEPANHTHRVCGLHERAF